MTVSAIRALFEPERIVFAPGAHDDAPAERALRANLSSPLLRIPVHELTRSVPEHARFDLGVIALPQRRPASVLDRMHRLGCEAVIFVNTGPGDAWRRADALRFMRSRARDLGMRALGPSRSGVIIPAAHLAAGAVATLPDAGTTALVTESDSVLGAMLGHAAGRAFGFSRIAAVGKASDVALGDVLDYLATDAATSAILLHLEHVADARRFVSAARAAVRTKPVLVLRGGVARERGRPGLGGLLRADDVYDAVFRRTGLVRVPSIEALFDGALALGRLHSRQVQGLARGRLAIVANGTSAALLAADAVVAGGGSIAQLNQATWTRLAAAGVQRGGNGCCLDLGDDAAPTRFVDALAAILAGGDADAVLLVHAPAPGVGPLDIARAVAARASELTGHLVIAALLGPADDAARAQLERAGLPCYDDTVDAVRAFLIGVSAARAQAQLGEIPELIAGAGAPHPEEAVQLVDVALAEGRHVLDATESLALLHAYGIPAAVTRTVRTVAEARAAAAALGYPVAVAGLVRGGGSRPARTEALQAASAAALARSSRTLQDRVGRARTGARVAGFVVQPVRPGAGALALLLGVTNDPTFGPVLVLGQGGPHFATIRDFTCALPPLNTALARAALAETRIGRLVLSTGGALLANVDALLAAIVQVSQLVADQGALAELFVNPLLAGPEGVFAVEARVRIAAQRRGAQAAARFAIRPYPKELERSVTLRDGTVVKMRPIRPEDARAMQRAFLRMTPEDRRMRLFTPMRELRDDLAARASAIDYDRELALVIEDPAQPGELWGGARIVADPDGTTAEYAVSTRSDAQGRGVGEAAVRAILQCAKERGIRTVQGVVLRENAPMRALARRLGFRELRDADEPDTVWTVMDL
ncbi:MAG: bifunctional acetate--CoA ligase family protein/GNAT family N-acetyltransferase [Burkholderiales bacterium]|nr:bifunctional acetate--CoA ligase family protein/GNAT family N-acetyltransferase [Burkholderiales bacterium]